MSVSDRYRRAWEGFWEDNSGEAGAPFWDADAALTAVPHLALLDPHVDRGLPIVDLGCGNGTQTRFLATRFPLAVGVDLSAAAIAHARRLTRGHVCAAGPEFETLNLADPDAVTRLARRTGEANVYMRAVLHQSDGADRGAVAGAIAGFLGVRGRAFVVEPTGAARHVLRLVDDRPGEPSEKLRQVRAHGLRPCEAPDGELAALFRRAGLEVLADGETALAMNEHDGRGNRVALPARWFVLRRAVRRPRPRAARYAKAVTAAPSR